MILKQRILGLDLGKRRVGVAVSDLLLITAQPLPPLEINGISDLLNKLAPIVEINKVGAMVLGRPVRLDGSADHLTEWVDKVKSKIEERFSLPIYFYDERLTSKMAQQAIHISGQKLKGNKHKLDSISASIILSDYLKAYASQNIN
jgi:putative Holliday junction resolvase